MVKKDHFAKTVIVTFFADESKMTPILEEKARELEGKFTSKEFTFVKAKISDIPQVADYFKVMALPHYVLLHGGHQIGVHTGPDSDGLDKLI